MFNISEDPSCTVSCKYALYFVTLLVILSLLLVIMGGQHDGVQSFLAARLSFTFILYKCKRQVFTCIFLWQTNSAAAVVSGKVNNQADDT